MFPTALEILLAPSFCNRVLYSLTCHLVSLVWQGLLPGHMICEIVGDPHSEGPALGFKLCCCLGISFEQKIPCFNFAVGPTSFVAGPARGLVVHLLTSSSWPLPSQFTAVPPLCLVPFGELVYSWT